MNRVAAVSAPIALCVFVVVPVAYAADPAAKCESGKLKEAGKYAACRLSEDSKAIKVGVPVDYSTCDSRFAGKWPRVEAAGEGMCPTNDDQLEIAERVTDYANDIAVLLSGGTLSDCRPSDLAGCTSDLADCGDDLTTCETNLGNCESLLGLPATGQVTCSNGAGAVVACEGTGQDGDVQASVARTFTDHGDGTITDNATGLMWEKLGDDGSIHDKDNQYTWSNAFAVKIAALNTASFAGYNDWRVPNYYELLTLVNAEDPPNFAEFNNGCTAGCSPTTCSCTVVENYWTSTTSEGTTRSQAYTVRFALGTGVIVGKGSTYPLRAVRSGLIPNCGNGIAEVGEECDGSNLGNASCLSLGYNLGGALGCSASCEYDTATCLHQPFPVSGQTTTYGPGDDGDIQAGAALTYVDNGDGTITDTSTGLMWEKKVALNNSSVTCTTETGSCANPHDADNRYSWTTGSTAYDGTVATIFLAQLNNRCDLDTAVSCSVDADCGAVGGACGFAGYRDWRLPNFKELHSIVDAERVNPAIDPAFDGVSCGDACTDVADPACSCVVSSSYWSSTTYADSPAYAWGVSFYGGYLLNGYKTGPGFARAVRDGH